MPPPVRSDYPQTGTMALLTMALLAWCTHGASAQQRPTVGR